MDMRNTEKQGTMLHERFCVKKVIGVGGFGITYLGEDTLLESMVAVKEYMPEGYLYTGLSGEEGAETEEKSAFRKGIDDFLREAKLLSLCQELDGIVSVRDFFEENGTAYLVMDYISGISVKEQIRNQGAQKPDEVLKLMKPVIFSLSRLHKVGYIHRDISGDNLLFTSQSSLKLIDFGAARKMNPDGEMTRTVMFKRGFAAEEQYRVKGKQGAWTDVYGICAVLYYMMTGVVPVEAIERVIHDEVVPLEKMPDICLDIEKKKAIDKGMSVFGKNRYQTMDALYEALYLEGIEHLPDGLDVSKEKEENISVSEEKEHIDRIRTSNFLATRTEFLQQRQAYYAAKQDMMLQRRKRRYFFVFILLRVAGAGAFFVWHSRNLQPSYRNGGIQTAAGESTMAAGDDRTRQQESGGEKQPEGDKGKLSENVETRQTGKSKDGQEENTVRKRVTVPKVVSVKEAKAVQKLKEKNLIPVVRYRYSSVKKGNVISQGVQEGIKVTQGKKIPLLVSKGQKKKSSPSQTPKPAEKNTNQRKSNADGKKNDSDQNVAGDITNLFQ